MEEPEEEKDREASLGLRNGFELMIHCLFGTSGHCLLHLHSTLLFHVQDVARNMLKKWRRIQVTAFCSAVYV